MIKIGPLSKSRNAFKDAPDRLALVVLCLVIFWFCQDLLFSSQVPFFRDLSVYFYPLRVSLYESLRAGELPLWDRHMAMGFPLLAAFQPGAFYPPHLMFLVLPFFPAIRAMFVFHFLIAAIGAFKLCREWKYPTYLCIVGALVFALGGMIISLSNLLNHFQSAVWLPWAVLFWERLLRRSSWTHFVIFTLILALQFLAGSPEIFAMGMVILVLDGLRIRPTVAQISYQRLFALLIGACLVFATLVMAQLLPTTELFLESRRQAAIPLQEALQWSLRPLSLLNLFFLDKEVDHTAPMGLRLFLHREPPFLVSYYLGAITIFGVLLGCFVGSLRERAVLITAIVISLLIALGGHTPIYPLLLHAFPRLGAFRFPEKVFFFTYCLIFYLSMSGLNDWFRDHTESRKKTIVALGAFCIAWAGLYGLLRANVSLLATFIARQTAQPLSALEDGKLIVEFIANVERQLVFFLIFFVLLALAKTRIIRQSLCTTLLLLGVFVDITWAHRGYLFSLRPDFAYAGERILTQPVTDLHRVFYYPSGRSLHPNTISVLGQPSYQQATALAFQNLLPNAGVFYGVDYMQEIDALARRPYSEFVNVTLELDLPKHLQLLRSLNVRYLVSFRPLTDKGLTLVSQFPQYFSWLYRLDQTTPRVYVVNRVSVETSTPKILRQLATTGFDPMQEVILDQPLSVQPMATFEASAKIVRYENNNVAIEAALNGSGILVLTDSFYPGWQVYVNGNRKPVLRANAFFRGVALTAGEHRVEFRYEPRSFRIGSAISLTAIGLLVVISLILYVKSLRVIGASEIRRLPPTALQRR